MSVSVFKTWISGEILTAPDLNASFSKIVSNGEDLAWPATKEKDFGTQDASDINDLGAELLTTSGLITSGGNFVSDTDSTDSIGSTGVRYANLFVDAITATNGRVPDAQGLLLTSSTVDGVGIASISQNGAGDHLVTFDNAASATDKQCVVATAEDTAAPRQVTVTNTSTTQVTVRNWIDTGAAITAQNSFPISITRHLI